MGEGLSDAKPRNVLKGDRNETFFRENPQQIVEDLVFP